MVPHRIDEFRGYVAGFVLLASACGPTSPTPDDGQTPPPTFAASGTVRQSGEGSPLEGAAVQASRVPPPSPTTPATETITNPQGAYHLEGLIGRVHLKVHKEGYEPAREDLFIAGATSVANVTLQPAVVVPAGSATMATLYPDDPTHTIAADIYGFENCAAPCRIIRVVSSVRATLLLRIRLPG